MWILKNEKKNISIVCFYYYFYMQKNNYFNIDKDL